jgi:hypothetical protein
MGRHAREDPARLADRCGQPTALHRHPSGQLARHWPSMHDPYNGGGMAAGSGFPRPGPRVGAGTVAGAMATSCVVPPTAGRSQEDVLAREERARGPAAVTVARLRAPGRAGLVAAAGRGAFPAGSPAAPLMLPRATGRDTGGTDRLQIPEDHGQSRTAEVQMFTQLAAVMHVYSSGDHEQYPAIRSGNCSMAKGSWRSYSEREGADSSEA